MVDAAHRGLQVCYEMLGTVNLLLEEMQNLNLRPSLLPSGGPGSITPSGTPHSSSPHTPSLSLTPNTPGSFSAAANHLSPSNLIHLALSGEEAVQDSLTRVAILRDKYVELSEELNRHIHQVFSEKPLPSHEKDNQMKVEEGVVEAGARPNTSVSHRQELLLRRQELRQAVYERNMDMKQLIDHMRILQTFIQMHCSASSASNTYDRSKLEPIRANID